MTYLNQLNVYEKARFIKSIRSLVNEPFVEGRSLFQLEGGQLIVRA